MVFTNELGMGEVVTTISLRPNTPCNIPLLITSMVPSGSANSRNANGTMITI